MAKIVPAILTDNLEDLQEKLDFFADKSEEVQIDISDGVYVKNQTLEITQANLCKTGLKIEWHLMVAKPKEHFLQITHPQTQIVTFQLEAAKNPDELLSEIKEKGWQAGLAIAPETKISQIKNISDIPDLILVLGVSPGYQGQEFIPETLDKIKELRQIYSGIIEVDGGIKTGIASQVVEAGADKVVIGSGILKAKDPVEEFELLKSEVELDS